MNDASRFGNALHVPQVTRLCSPSTDEEREELAVVAHALRSMSLTGVDLILPVEHEPPYVSIRFSGGARLDPYWAKYLFTKIYLVDGGQWIARLSHIAVKRREFWLTPRQDGTNPGLANDAIRRSPRPIVRVVTLGTLYPLVELRCFDLFHRRPLH